MIYQNNAYRNFKIQRSFFLVLWMIGIQPVLFSQVTYNNPLVPGADPVVVDGRDGNYYLFVTGGQTRRFKSTDLIHWSNHLLLDDVNLAPHVIYYEPTDTWYIYTNLESAKGPKVDGQFKKFRDGFGFDQMYYNDGDGSHYIFTGGWSYGHELHVLENPETAIKTLDLHYVTPWWGSVWEGQYILKHNGTYYNFFSVNGASGPDYRLAYATSSSVTGPYVVQTPGIDACFLRRSDSEFIYGPGHHCIIKDNNGIYWTYYQQKDGTAKGWDRRVAVDPLWFDKSGVPHIRPTRKIDKPGPNSAVNQIWPERDAFSWQEAETYDGSAVIKLKTGATGRMISHIYPGAYLAFRNVNFGSGANGFSANASCFTKEEGNGVIKIYLDGIYEELVGVCKIGNTGDQNEFQIFSCKLKSTISNVHDIFLVFQGPKPDMKVMHLDNFVFTQKAENDESFDNPPSVVDDTVNVILGSEVRINLVYNDFDPEGDSIRITGVNSLSNKGNQILRSDPFSVIYKALSEYWGEDHFSYIITDGNGNFTKGEVFINVVPSPGLYHEENGLVVIEAEEFAQQFIRKDSNQWINDYQIKGSANDGYVFASGIDTDMEEGTILFYPVNITTPGKYYVWARVKSADNSGDESYLGFNPYAGGSRFMKEKLSKIKGGIHGWQWIMKDQQDVLRAGLHKFALSHGTYGHLIDRFVITRQKNFDPAAINNGMGPKESYHGIQPNKHVKTINNIR